MRTLRGLSLKSPQFSTDLFHSFFKVISNGRVQRRQVRIKPPVSDTLENAADLESIELVANEVLAMQMPTTPAQLQNLTDEIRQKVAELGGVDTILQQSADDILRAENLLEQARTVR